MIRLIFSWFGYAKIPVEAVQLAMLVNNYFQSRELPEYYELDYRKASETLLQFLRSGKLLQ
jgi:hypothetical protein